MAIPEIRVTREEMRKRVARFKDLKGFDKGLLDSEYPSAYRTLYNAVGFQPPKGKGGSQAESPVGAAAAAFQSLIRSCAAWHMTEIRRTQFAVDAAKR